LQSGCGDRRNLAKRGQELVGGPRSAQLAFDLGRNLKIDAPLPRQHRKSLGRHFTLQHPEDGFLRVGLARRLRPDIDRVKPHRNDQRDKRCDASSECSPRQHAGVLPFWFCSRFAPGRKPAAGSY
jgi:hypothetical protein